MEKNNKTHDQLIPEVEKLHRRISILESDKQILQDSIEEMARFKIISDSAGHGNAIVDLDGKIVYINNYFARKHGYTPEELLGQNLSVFHTEKQMETVEEIIRSMTDSGRYNPVEVEHVHRDGARFTMLMNGIFLNDRNGKPEYIAAAATDIEQWKVAEKLLAAEKNLSAEYLKLANIMFIALDTEGTVTLANKKSCEVLGWKEEDIVGKNWFDNFLPVHLRKAVKTVALQIMHGNLKPVETYENPVLTKNGEERLIAWHNTTLRNEAGEITGHLSAGEDITSRRLAENKLLLGERILEASQDHISVVGSDYTYRYVNKAHTCAYGLPSSQIVGVNIADLLDTGIFEKTVKPYLDICFSGEKVTYECWFSFKETGNRYMAVTCLPLLDNDDNIKRAVVISHDITNIKIAELENQELEKQVLQAQKLESLGVLAGGIAHDFNNILMAILGNADLALMDISTADPAYGNIKAIETAAKRAADLAKQMLAYSGKGKFLIEKIDLNEAVDEMTHILEVSISKKAVIKYHHANGLPLIEADATQIRQIIMNLVTNASDAIDRTSGVISIKTGTMDCNSDYLASTYIDESLDSGQYVYVEVTDTGCGMDKETQKKLFDPFFTTKFTGRGLGLSAVLGIIRGHKGAIKIYSEPDRGTSIKVLFPACDCSAVSREQLNGDTGKPWTCSGTILLVDDEETILSVGKQMLQRIGFEVLTASNGYEAVKVFRENSSDITLVILDLIMPHLDGEETFREIRRIRNDVLIIMCSGYNEQEVTQRFTEKSLAGFLHKPYMFRELVSKLRVVLNGK